jgi:hypothetical protein
MKNNEIKTTKNGLTWEQWYKKYGKIIDRIKEGIWTFEYIYYMQYPERDVEKFVFYDEIMDIINN